MSTTATSTTTLQMGDTGTAVKDLQKLLLTRVGVGGLTADGVFGSITDLAVRVFQGRNFLTDDGIVGPQTWEVLLNGGRAHLPTLRRGSRGALVERLQRALAVGKLAQEDLNLPQFYRGAIDGDFGPLTEQAVKSFQRGVPPQFNALSSVDGIVGPETWTALSSLVARIQHLTL